MRIEGEIAQQEYENNLAAQQQAYYQQPVQYVPCQYI